MMHKHILTALLGDEPKAFFVVPPFYFAASHNLLSSIQQERGPEKAKDTNCRCSVCPKKSLLEPHTPLICDDNKKTLYAGQAFVFNFTPIAMLVPGTEGDGTKWLRHSRPWSRRQLSQQLADSRPSPH